MAILGPRLLWLVALRHSLGRVGEGFRLRRVGIETQTHALSCRGLNNKNRALGPHNTIIIIRNPQNSTGNYLCPSVRPLGSSLRKVTGRPGHGS